MGSRTLPFVCEHGKVLDWGDHGPDPDDGSVGAERCEVCDPLIGFGDETCRACGHDLRVTGLPGISDCHTVVGVTLLRCPGCGEPSRG